MSFMNPELFLQKYELKFDKEFELDGRAAEWAPGTFGPRFWGAEDRVLDLVKTDPSTRYRPSTTTSLSADHRFLAAATNAVIRIYEVASFQLRAELVGHEESVEAVVWAPTPRTGDAKASHTEDENGGYRLLSAGSRGTMDGGQIILWALDGKARQIDRIMPFAVDALAKNAMDAMFTDLTTHHDLDAGDLETLRADIVKTLVTADTRNRVKALHTLTGTLGSFRSTTWSSDGSKIIFIIHGGTTQHGMRPPDQLPRLVVYDLAKQCSTLYLQGHTDGIMLAAWSPDDATIATASWDQTYRIWDAATGVCRHVLGPTKGQNWSGAFSHDGKHVVLSGGNPTQVAVWNVSTGEEVALYPGIGNRRSSWIREIAWHPSEDCIALIDGQSVVLWSPSLGVRERREDSWTEVLKLKSDGSILENYARFSNLLWVDGGAKLLVQTNDHTSLLWDRERMWKWRLQRPMGTPLDMYALDMGFRRDGETQVVWSSDGDWKVREWKI